MAGDFHAESCPLCGLKGTLNIRSSRYVTKRFKVCQLICKNCDHITVGEHAFGEPLWPSRQSSEEEIRQEFTPHVVKKNLPVIKAFFREDIENANAKVKELTAQLKAAKQEVKYLETTYDLLLDIGFGKADKAG
ncbi:hypothetical protein [Chromobacterium amazonense]|uniref:Uncharacterized protein n=1 Tax=Chromobacterium amazonense TaxID=1382803 RepID=A0ABU8UZM7_9NEIS|nr:hypothetical protein [Chromobacterium amazonense]MDQ4539706.1 hypothetical protein [Chromobacterium amazonense]